MMPRITRFFGICLMMKTFLLARHALGADEDAACGDNIVPKKRVPPKRELKTGDAPTPAMEMEGVEWRRNYAVKFKVHQPYNLPLDGESRFKLLNEKDGHYNLTVYKDDLPFECKEGKDITCPRTEFRFLNMWNAGFHQIAAEVYVEPGTQWASIFQFKHVNSTGHRGTCVQILVDDKDNFILGPVTNPPQTILAYNVTGRWLKVRMVHNAGAGKVLIYVGDVKQPKETDDLLEVKANKCAYFKVGVYARCNSSRRDVEVPSTVMSAQFRRIAMYDDIAQVEGEGACG